MKIKGIGRLQIIARTIQNRIGANAVILLYHRINEGIPDPQRLVVSPAHFSEHLSLLCQMTDPVSLEELPLRLRSRKRSERPLSLITFDDGYADNLEQAGPILAQHGVPATVFVAAAGINAAHEFYWDVLEHILMRPDLPPSLSLKVESRTYTWDFSGDRVIDASWDVLKPYGNNVQQAYLHLCRLLVNLPPAGRAEVLEQLFVWSGLNRHPRPSHRTMTEEEICSLTASGLIDVGAHTVNHPTLSMLTLRAQAQEIHESRVRLEKIVNRPILTFSYPYGRAQDYTRQTVKLVRDEGFHYACSNFPGLTNRWTDPFQLPRLCVQDIDGERFSKMISGVFETYC